MENIFGERSGGARKGVIYYPEERQVFVIYVFLLTSKGGKCGCIMKRVWDVLLEESSGCVLLKKV